MGYTTDFRGAFKLDKPLTPELQEFLTAFADTRRMKRKESGLGVENEFQVDDNQAGVLDGNFQPSTQPGLWCQWVPNEDGTEIEWDGVEKFYMYTEWIVYLIEKILKPNGYTVNGEVKYRGEEWDDNGVIQVRDNYVYLDGRPVRASEPGIRLDVTYTGAEPVKVKQVAKLVAVSLLTRVIVDEDASDEDILDKAKTKFQDKLNNNELDDNLEYIEDDTECPYGTLIGDKSKIREVGPPFYK
tara:strand:+ start:1092 stop:1817 length:726 start_codon:yes stop_codon:yes gene_type:complete